MMNFIRKLFGLFKSKPQLDVVYDFQTFNTRTIMHEGDGKPYELKPGNGKDYYSIPDPESKLIILPRSHRGQFTKKLISLMKKVMRGQGD